MSTRLKLRLTFVQRVALAAPIAVGILNGTAIWAQSPPATGAPPRFEVAAVKPCKDGDSGGGRNGGRRGGGASASPGRLDLGCQTVRGLIQMAYVQYADGKRRPSEREVAIEGGAAWTESERFQITATAEGAPGQEMMRGPMLQALLEDRFQVRIHRETREVPVYALTVAKSGPKLPVSKEGSCIPRNTEHPVPPSERPPGLFPCGVFAPSKDGSAMYGTTLANFCTQLSIVMDRAVVDKTGLAGVFDIAIQRPPADPAPDAPADGQPRMASPRPSRMDLTEPGGLSVLAAIERVGLRLEPAKGSGEFLVIDHAGRPAEN
jgi:uncharacterized protein (TIGR03435 family)